MFMLFIACTKKKSLHIIYSIRRSQSKKLPGGPPIISGYIRVLEQQEDGEQTNQKREKTRQKYNS